MASRRELKEQRRREREAHERAALQAERRQRRVRIIGGALGVAVLAAGGIALAITRGGGNAGDAFAAKTGGLEQRLAEVNLAPGPDHFHPTVKVFVGQRAIPVPEDIGGAGGSMMSPIHRHAGDEALHVEGAKEGAVTLGQFMQLWDVPLSPTRLGPYRADGQRSVRMWVKDKGDQRFRESREFGRLKLRDGQQVYLYYGTPQQAPIKS